MTTTAMVELIEYCLGNVDAEFRTQLREHDCKTVEKTCLQRCYKCVDGALLVIDGHPQWAETHDELLEDLEGE